MADPFLVPPGWSRSRRAGRLVVTRPGSPTARLELRRGAATAAPGSVVEDEEVVERGGRPVGYRRLGHRGDGVDLLSEEWSWDDPVRGPLVLTGTVERTDYLSVCELFEDVAATLDPEAG